MANSDFCQEFLVSFETDLIVFEWSTGSGSGSSSPWPLVQRENGTVSAAPRRLGHQVRCGLGGPICVLVLDLPFGVG